MKSFVRNILRQTGMLNCAYRLYEHLWPAAIKNAQTIRKRGDELFRGDSREGFSPALQNLPVKYTALIMGVSSVDIVMMQAPQIIAARFAGYELRVILATPAPALENIYRKLGVSSFIYMTESLGREIHPEATILLDAVQEQADLHKQDYRGIPAGKFALSTYMRRTRRGRIDVSDPAVRSELLKCLSQSLHHTDDAIGIMDAFSPDLVFFIDRGYTPEGEVFEAALLSGAEAITMNTAHRGGYVMYKRYGPLNKGQHPVSLSQESWQSILNMAFSNKHWQMTHGELADAYGSGQWYDEVGTQFGKSLLDKASIISQLGLDPHRKTAVLFAHMFWDATFFWGEDLFEDYEEWFIESLKAMAKNNRLNWVIKLHPANNVKNARDGFTGEHVEYDAIRRAVGELPSHIKILAPEAPISTFSLFEMIDYCLTVRGTVGIEAACFGIPVITAGTGRYDGLGFTKDHQTQEEYLKTLETLEDIPPMDQSATELARRYAWGILFARTLGFETVDFSYAQNSAASLQISANPTAIKDPSNAPDIVSIREWLESGSEDMIALEM